MLIQVARKEEEEQYPEQRINENTSKSDHVKYVAERLLKLKPAKRISVLNSISAMFQFQGGIADSDRDDIFSELQKQKIIHINESGRITY